MAKKRTGAPRHGARLSLADSPMTRILMAVDKLPDEFKELTVFMDLLDEEGENFSRPFHLSRIDTIQIDAVLRTIPRINEGTKREQQLNQMIEKIPPMVMDCVDYV